jgi:hypothetical protein
VARISRTLGIASILSMWVLLAACGQKSPEERVAAIRSQYSARLNGFILEEEPVVTEVPELEAVEIAETDDSEEPEVVGLEEEMVAEPEVIQKVRLDILIQHRSDERLPGVTVDISMVDSQQNEKGHWRVWFDTSNVAKATVTQFTHILEDVGYEEGDGFFVEVRNPIPPDERSEYREFSNLS